MSSPSKHHNSPTSMAGGGDEEDVAPPPYDTEGGRDAVMFTYTALPAGALSQPTTVGIIGQSSQAEAPQTLANLLKRANEDRGPNGLETEPGPLPYVRDDQILGGVPGSSEALLQSGPHGNDPTSPYSPPESDGSAAFERGQAESAGGCLSALASVATRTEESVRALISKKGSTWRWFSMCFGVTEGSDDSTGSTARQVDIFRVHSEDALWRDDPGVEVLARNLTERNDVPTSNAMTRTELELLLDQEGSSDSEREPTD